MTSSKDQGGGSVLVVDDNQANLKLLRSLLRDRGFAVRVATSGAMALDSVRAESPALILLDVQMQPLSGYDVCEALKADGTTRDIPVIFVSAASDPFDKVRAFEVGGVDYITKPFESTEVLARVNNHIRLNRLQVELQEANETLERRVDERTAKLLESEEVYRATFEQARVGIAHVSLDFRFLRVNQRFCAILGYSSEELLLQTPVDITHPDDKAAVHAVQEEVMGGTDGVELVKRYLKKDGDVVWSDTTISAIRDVAGEPEALVVIVRDITEAKQAERERADLEAQLHHAQRMETIGTLAAGVAHDFNNLLVPILGFSRLAHRQLATSDPIRKHLQRVFESAERASRLVRQILTLSREVTPQRESVRWEEVVEEALDLLRASVPATVQIRTNIALDLPPVFADPNQLHQVVMNLGTNAAHAMRLEGGTLEVTLDRFQADEDFLRAHPELQQADCVRLSTSDTGEGMDARTIKRMFEPFFTTKGVGEGSGLGLSVVHGIVLNHGGGISVESEVGEGTTFHVVLASGTTSASNTPVSPERPSNGGDEHILVIDDEPSIVVLAEESLRDVGYEVSSTTSSEEALRLFRMTPDAYDLVITDQTMPFMTGTELASEFILIRADTPIILASGYHAPPLTEGPAEGDVRWRLKKPYGIDELAGVVRRVLDENKNRK